MVETMQFRDFIFRHNPKNIAMSSGQQAVRHLCPGKGEIVQNLGRVPREVRCTGSFLGKDYSDAIAQVTDFRKKAEQKDAGLLMLPGVEPFLAHLREFNFEAGGDGRILAYSMLFAEI